MNSVTESEFLPPSNVLMMTEERRAERKATKHAMRPQRVLTKGGARVVKVKLSIPVEQYAGLQRFEGADDAERINMLIRMANRRVDDVVKQQEAEARKALEQST
jgi:hypothetical protein